MLRHFAIPLLAAIVVVGACNLDTDDEPDTGDGDPSGEPDPTYDDMAEDGDGEPVAEDAPEPVVTDAEDAQTLTAEAAAGPGCWNFDKGALGKGVRYLKFSNFSWGGTKQVIHAVRIQNDNSHVLGYRTNTAARTMIKTATFAQGNRLTRVAINGDFRDIPSTTKTWGLWKSKGKVFSADSGHPFIAYGAKDGDGQIRSWFYGPHAGNKLSNVETPGARAISGFPILVEDGQVTAPNNCEFFPTLCDQRHPRTAHGLSKDGRFTYWVIVEGRLPGAGGLTAHQLGTLMKQKVCAHSAFNQDGGGSSTMWIRGRGVVNRCAEGTCRNLINHIGVNWKP